MGEPHNPETGEIDGDTSDADGGAQQTDQTDGRQPAPAEDPAKPALMAKLRDKAKGGTSALRRALGGLAPVQNEMLSNEDHDALGDLADAADKAREPA